MTLAWWPFIDLSLTLPWPCSHLALTLPWPCFDLALTLPWPSLDLALTLPCPCLDLALTLPWPCLDVASEGWHGPRSLLLKFGQNRISNYWDIPNMDKCHQDKCCLDKCRYGSWNRFNMVLGNCHLNLVEIVSVTAEIFLIWTNVARTNDAWTNVPVTVGTCSIRSQEPMIKVLSKSVQ